MGDFFINLYQNSEYIKIVLGYIVSVVLIILGIKQNKKSNIIVAITICILVTLLLIVKILNL